MKVFHIIAALLVASVSALTIHQVDDGVSSLVYRAPNPVNYSLLAAQLSPGASIVFPDNPQFDLLQQRWQEYSRPTYSAIVQAATEDDVRKTVLFANKYSLPFLAVAGAHGFLTTLGRMQGGIAISLANMKGISLSKEGDCAELQPGLTNGELIRYLWARGKQAVAGNCLCTGIMGIMLGGGHSFLQGLHGLLADQILEASVVLANGELVVASPTSNPDLFWALRGAGHNFGIVTRVKYKIHNAIPKWTFSTIIFTQDKLEKVFEAANALLPEADHPAELILMYQLVRLPIDPKSASIVIYLVWGGDAAGLDKYADPFRALGPAQETLEIDISYPDVFTGRVDEASPGACAKGWYRHMFGNYLKRFNPEALRKAHTIFTDATDRYPGTKDKSMYIIESYSQQGVTAVPFKSTAVPFRDYPILGSPVWGYTNASYTNGLVAASREMRKILTDGDGDGKLRSYVNYAFGDEALSENYGHEPWRVKKLKALKKKYDPEGRFSFYAPIDVGRRP